VRLEGGCRVESYGQSSLQGIGRLRNQISEEENNHECHRCRRTCDCNRGTDYGHADYSNDIEAIQTLARGGKISPSLAQKILGDNPKRLYGL
jgi:hypothetical protein